MVVAELQARLHLQALIRMPSRQAERRQTPEPQLQVVPVEAPVLAVVVETSL